MDGLEKMAEDLTVIQDKGKRFRQSIISLLGQWRDFEGQLNLADKALNFSASLESRENDLEQREKDILLFVEKKKKILELKEEKLIRYVQNYAQEVEKNLMVQQERARGLLEKLEFKKLEMLEIRNFVEKRLLEIGERENHLVLVQDSLERKRVEVLEKENMCKERAKEVESKVEELNLMIENIEFKEKQVDYIRQIYENQLNDLNMKKEKLENKFEFLKTKEIIRIEDVESNKHCVRGKVRYSLEQEVASLHIKDKVKSSSEQEFKSDKAVSSNIRENGGALEKEKLQQQFEVLELRQKEINQLIKEFNIKKDCFQKFLHNSKETLVTLEKEKPTQEYKILLEEKEKKLHSEDSKVTLEKETHKRRFNFEKKEVEESSKELRQQYFSYHSRNKYPPRRLGTFYDPPHRNYSPRRYNGKRRR